jgi:hypothetical protein
MGNPPRVLVFITHPPVGSWRVPLGTLVRSGEGRVTDFQCRTFAALDKDWEGEDPSDGVLAVNLKELLCFGRQSHNFTSRLLFLGHDFCG